jgi:TM2 domain-containing membrane protein YozV
MAPWAKSRGECVQGRILDYDFRTGLGEIAGDDGNRYQLTGLEWRHAVPPRVGQIVDFKPADDCALAVYSIGGAGGEKNRIAAALLAFFLGSLGVHKFYLNKVGAGVAMLLISIFGLILLGLPTLVIWVISFVEFIIYLTMSDEQFELKYVKGDQAWF